MKGLHIFNFVISLFLFFVLCYHKSDISQLSLKNFNQMIDMACELFHGQILKPPSNDDFSELCNKAIFCSIIQFLDPTLIRSIIKRYQK